MFAADFLIRDGDVLKRMKACDSNFVNVAKALCILSSPLLMLLMFTAGCGTIASAENLLVYFLDVGQADAAILQCGDEVMMIDGGESSDSSLIYSYLTKTLGITHIDYMIATHPHADHIGGLSNYLKSIGGKLVPCTQHHEKSPAAQGFPGKEKTLTFVSGLQG